LLRRIDALMPDYEIELRPVPWKRGLRMLETGQAFGLYPPYRLEAERPYIVHYSAPLATEHLVIVCRDDRIPPDFKGRWPRDFLGRTLSTNLGYALQTGDFWKPIQEGRIRHLEFPGNRENLVQMAVLGKVDCYANDRSAIDLSYGQLASQLAQSGKADTLARIREVTVLESQTAHVGYGRVDDQHFPDGGAFIRRFDQTLEAFKATPEYRRLIDEFWAEIKSRAGPAK
jgi:polar amino acid transport system substrate-binding protein